MASRAQHHQAAEALLADVQESMDHWSGDDAVDVDFLQVQVARANVHAALAQTVVPDDPPGLDVEPPVGAILRSRSGESMWQRESLVEDGETRTAWVRLQASVGFYTWEDVQQHAGQDDPLEMLTVGRHTEEA